MRRFALLGLALLCPLIASAQEVGQYPTATSPLNGSERLVGDQNGITVNVTSSQIAQYTAQYALIAPLGSFVTNDCLKVGQVNPLLIADAGLACGSGGGGTINPGPANAIAYYNGAGTQLAGIAQVPVAQGGTGASSLAGANIAVFSGSITAGDCAYWITPTSLADTGLTCSPSGTIAASPGALLTISGGPQTATGAGGALVLEGGTSVSGAGGNAYISGGASTTGGGGSTYVNSGVTLIGNDPSGSVYVSSANATATTGTGGTGPVSVYSGSVPSTDTAGNTGPVSLYSGNNSGTGAQGSGAVSISSGSVAGTGGAGNISISGGASSGSGTGGFIFITPGYNSSTGASGSTLLRASNFNAASVAVDPNANLIVGNGNASNGYGGGYGAYADQGYFFYSITGNITTPANTGTLVVDAGTQTTLTIKFPPNPVDGQHFEISFVGAITTLTLQDSGGTAGNVLGAPTSAAANTGYSWRYIEAGGVNKWVRRF